MKKKNTIFFIILSLIVLAVFFINNVSVNINLKDGNNPNNKTNPTQTNNSSETKENSEGSVAITVTPLNLKNNSSTWNFEVDLNTHSGSLDANLITISELMDDQKKLYKPISWEGDGPGGHHRKGILKFNPISLKSKFFELKIKNIGGVLERSFKWNL